MGFDLIAELRAAVAGEIERLVPALVKRAIADGQEPRITLQEYRGGNARANAAFERRHDDLVKHAVVVGRRRYYLRSDLDRFFGAQSA
jgi:hypothetical protein